MFKRFSAVIATATLVFGGLAAMAAAPASAKTPIDPAGTYLGHGDFQGLTFTLTDESGKTAGSWSDDFGDTGSWSTSGNVIAFAFGTGVKDPELFIGTLNKKGISSAKKPGTDWMDSNDGTPSLGSWWATK
jgi:hypothetical protein